ncbi:MGH1-like glycoside hydrolase domain-containing protein [Novosphingobium percolationis]|uniref:MGH1-like glycoside hydrolase domain-containing protein n=1 Tax=Novosphingobium percolationis TaxID=2871811 RepID=UPI001CD20790|nr:discoidin domain-containing protein [Novosphingobium percolationis]
MRRTRWQQSLLAGVLAALSLGFPACAEPHSLDHVAIAHTRFGNDADWYEGRIPFFESADPGLDAVYYYRWALLRAHQRDLGAQGFVSTEFLDDVSWQREPFASLNDASGFHINEARWLNDRRYADDTIAFMYAGGNDRHFSDYMADAVWNRYLVDGDRVGVTRHLPVMRHIYRLWDEKFDFAKGLYFIEPLLDATEYTVSSIDASGGADGFRGGDAFRPSINSYMAANARAIARIAALAGDEATARDYAARADDLRARMVTDLWSQTLGHFIDRHQQTNAHVRYWQPIRARELVGFVPWMFDLAPDDAVHAAAWAHLLDPAMLAGKAGPRTVEAGYEYYLRQYRYLGDAPECQWNGPIWPYQSTQVLLGMANLLDHYADPGPVTRRDYLRLLRQYAALHRQADGRLDLEEDYDPETGRPIVGLARSHHYFHSGFIDLILTGLVGIRPRADDMVEINPLLPPFGDAQGLRWFRVEDVPYHGHRLAVTWDAEGRRYGRGSGLTLEVDGRPVAHRDTLGRITVPIARLPAPAPDRAIDLAVQLVRGEYPLPSASTNTDAEALHDAVDGRIWFFPEQANGWSSAAVRGEQWFALDLGKPTEMARAELAFFADGKAFDSPARYRIEAMIGGAWQPLPARADTARANGVTHIAWPVVRAARYRLAFEARPKRAVRLVEFKLFATPRD